MILRDFEADFEGDTHAEADAAAKKALEELPWKPEFSGVSATMYVRNGEQVWVVTAKAHGKEF